jgi:hypothetical protein
VQLLQDGIDVAVAMQRSKDRAVGLIDWRLTNKKIQAQRLMEPQIPLRASRVVRGWAAAVAMAAVNMESMLCV